MAFGRAIHSTKLRLITSPATLVKVVRAGVSSTEPMARTISKIVCALPRVAVA